jgi:3-methyl-2-oxobutanoate hydroxymethyltransferase
VNVHDFAAAKRDGRKLTFTTCYDWWSARILNESPVDGILVGDSAAMVMHGHPTTLPATPEMMSLHIGAVARGAPDKFLVGDMPFPWHRRGIADAMEVVDAFLTAGAHAVKLEGIEGHEEIVRHIVGSGVPVMGHVGLTPQSVNALGGYRIQGRSEETADRLVQESLQLEQAGCFSLVVEGVASETAAAITRAVSIPTIGIGAGAEVDGQVLVLHDLAGLQREVKPKFVRKFADGYGMLLNAVEEFDRAVKDGSFPAEDETYE